MRMLLRAILSAALLLGSGVGDWLPVSEQAHESCCCGMPAGIPDTCPCPKPEGNRTPTNAPCTTRTVVAAAPAVRRTQAERRTEPRPEPVDWAWPESPVVLAGQTESARGRDPDLGRHLARLSTFRI